MELITKDLISLCNGTSKKTLSEGLGSLRTGEHVRGWKNTLPERTQPLRTLPGAAAYCLQSGHGLSDRSVNGSEVFP